MTPPKHSKPKADWLGELKEYLGFKPEHNFISVEIDYKSSKIIYWEEIHALITAKINKEKAQAELAKNNAYKERDMLVAALSKLYPAWIGYHEGEDWEDDWRTIIYIKLPSGQVSWHIHDSEKPLFDHLDPGIEEWDGHTTEEKYERLAQLTKDKESK